MSTKLSQHNNVAKKIIEDSFPDCELVPSEGRFERHPHGMVGNLFRIQSPKSVRIGDCFMAGRLKSNDLWLCTEHSGDCFQNYIFVEEYANCLVSDPNLSFGSYGIRDSKKITLNPGEFEVLKNGGRIEREFC
jgi:hypothetical protein